MRTEQQNFIIFERVKSIRERLICLGMTNSTIKTYCSAIRLFLNHVGKVADITEEEVLIYLDYLILNKGYSSRSRNLISRILTFYFREFLDIKLDIRKSKEDKAIPRVCWDNQLREILSVTHNIKHKLCLWLMRYSGLRSYEVIRIKKHHVLPDGRILVKEGKGKKDRFTILPAEIRSRLEDFIKLLPEQNPYIFQGNDGKSHYSGRTPLKILHNAFIKLNWPKDKWVGCHSLRHAFTIYCLDNKIGDYDEVSKWLGHSVKQTTQIYTQCRQLDLMAGIKKYDALKCVIP